MKKKKIPMRKYILLNEMYPKEDMTRVVINREGEAFTDVTGKRQGRGAYVSKDATMVGRVQQKEILEKYLEASKERLDPVYGEIIGLIYREEILEWAQTKY